MKSTTYILILILFLGAKSPKETEDQIRVRVLEQIVCTQQDMLYQLEDELEDYRNHVKRMQKIVGAKDIDSVFSYKKKIVYKKQLLSCK